MFSSAAFEVEEVVAGAALGQSQHLADGVGEEAAGAVKAVVRLTQQAVVLADLGETGECWTTQTRRSFPIVAVTGGVFFESTMLYRKSCTKNPFLGFTEFK